MANGTVTPQPIPRAKTQRFILITGSIVILAMTYGSGMRQQTKKLQDITQQLKIVRRGLRASELGRQADIALVHQLEARRLLDASLEAIASRNYGTAQDIVKDAIAHLETASTVQATNIADTSVVLKGLKALTGDPNPNQLTALVHQLDEALDKVSPRTDYQIQSTIPPPTGNDEVDPEYEFGKRTNP